MASDGQKTWDMGLDPNTMRCYQLIWAVLWEVPDHIALHTNLGSHRLDPSPVHCPENLQPYHLLLRLNCYQAHALVAAGKIEITSPVSNQRFRHFMSEITWVNIETDEWTAQRFVPGSQWKCKSTICRNRRPWLLAVVADKFPRTKSSDTSSFLILVRYY